MQLKTRTEYTIQKPVEEVFEAIVDTSKMSGYFISRASKPRMEPGPLEWHFDDVGVTGVPLNVLEVRENELIAFEWSFTNIPTTRIDITLSRIDDNSSRILIVEQGWNADEAGIKRIVEQTQGWTDFVCSLKTYLHTGLNLRRF